MYSRGIRCCRKSAHLSRLDMPASRGHHAMRTKEFRKWLEAEYLQRSGRPLAAGTQVSRAANCSTVEQYEGDLDEHFNHDGLAGLLRKLNYTTDDQAEGRKPRHRIPINGDIANGSTTYRSAIQLYRKFRVARMGTPPDGDGMLGEDQLLSAVLAEALTKTEREALVKSRIGQGRFRSLVLELWDYRCAVTGTGLLLTASHIKPWKTSTNHERLDGWNGLALSPTFDRAFDSGLITFNDEGGIQFSPRLPAVEAALLGIKPALRIRRLQNRHRPYLVCHRESIFLK